MSSENSNGNQKLKTVAGLLTKIERTDSRSLAWPTAQRHGANNNQAYQPLDLYPKVPLLYSAIDLDNWFKETISENEYNKGNFFNILYNCKALGKLTDGRFSCVTVSKPKKKKVSSKASSHAIPFGPTTHSNKFLYKESDNLQRKPINVPRLNIVQYYKTPVQPKRHETKNNTISLSSIKWMRKSIDLMSKSLEPKNVHKIRAQPLKKNRMKKPLIDRTKNVLKISKKTIHTEQRTKHPLHGNKKISVLNQNIDAARKRKRVRQNKDKVKEAIDGNRKFLKRHVRKIDSVSVKRKRTDMIRGIGVRKKIPLAKERKKGIGDNILNIYHIYKQLNRDMKKKKLELKRKIPETKEPIKSLPYRKLYNVPKKREGGQIVQGIDLKKRPETKGVKKLMADVNFTGVSYVSKKRKRDIKVKDIKVKTKMLEAKKAKKKKVGNLNLKMIQKERDSKREGIDLKMHRTDGKQKIKDVKYKKIHHLPKKKKRDNSKESIDLKIQRKDEKQKFPNANVKKIRPLPKKPKSDTNERDIEETIELPQRKIVKKKFLNVMFRKSADRHKKMRSEKSSNNSVVLVDVEGTLDTIDWDQSIYQSDAFFKNNDRPFKKYRPSSKQQSLENKRKREQKRDWQRMFSNDSLDILEDYERANEYILKKQTYHKKSFGKKLPSEELSPMYSEDTSKDAILATGQTSSTEMIEASSQKKKKFKIITGGLQVVENTKVVNVIGTGKQTIDGEDSLFNKDKERSNLNRYRELGYFNAFAKKKRSSIDISANSLSDNKIKRTSSKSSKLRIIESKTSTTELRHSSTHAIDAHMKNWWLHTGKSPSPAMSNTYSKGEKGSLVSYSVERPQNFGQDFHFPGLPKIGITHKSHYYHEPDYLLAFKLMQRPNILQQEFQSQPPVIKFVKPFSATAKASSLEEIKQKARKKSYESIHSEFTPNIESQKVEETHSEKLTVVDVDSPTAPFLYYPYDMIYSKDPETPPEVKPVPKGKGAVKRRKVKKVRSDAQVHQIKSCCCICNRLYRNRGDDPFIAKLKRQMKRQQLKLYLRNMQRLKPVDEATHETKLKFQCTDDIAPCCQIVPSVYRTPRY